MSRFISLSELDEMFEALEKSQREMYDNIQLENQDNDEQDVISKYLNLEQLEKENEELRIALLSKDMQSEALKIENEQLKKHIDKIEDLIKVKNPIIKKKTILRFRKGKKGDIIPMCNAKTRKGKRCKFTTVNGSPRCLHHSPK